MASARLVGLLMLTSALHGCNCCTIGEEQWRDACSRLSAAAGWRTFTRKEANNECTYTSPPGWVIMENAVEKLEQRGETHVGLHTTNQKVDSTYSANVKEGFDRAIDLAAGYEMFDVAAKIGLKWETMKGTYSRILHEGAPILRATVKASAFGHFFNRGTSRIIVKVKAKLRCIGSLDTNEVYQNLIQEFELPESEALVAPSADAPRVAAAAADPKTTLIVLCLLLLLIIILIVAGVVFCYFRRLLCFKRRAKVINAPVPAMDTVVPVMVSAQKNTKHQPELFTKRQGTPPPVPPKPSPQPPTTFIRNLPPMEERPVPTLPVYPEPPPSYRSVQDGDSDSMSLEDVL